MSEIAVVAMSEQDARRLTERIRIAAVNYTDAKEKLFSLVDEAKRGNAHVALKYDSWTGYLQDVLTGEPLRLARTERPAVAGYLADQGMPNTLIAKTLGVHDTTVMRDLRSANAEREPRQVVRTDGQVLTVPARLEPQPEHTESPKQKRRPLTDQARDAGWELRRAVERLERIYSDDRYMRSQNEIDSLIEPHIEYALSVITTH